MPIDYQLIQRFGEQPSFAEKFARDYAAMGERQNRLAQLAQQQEMQGYQMRGLQRAEERAPIEQARADLAYQQQQVGQQAEALRRQQEAEQMQSYLETLPTEERMAVKIAPKEYFGAKFVKQKPEDILGGEKLKLEREKFAWEKGKQKDEEKWQTIPTDQGIVQVHPKTGEVRQLGIQAPKKQSEIQKPMPATALKMQQEELDAIGSASSLNADLGTFKEQVQTGELPLGLVKNVAGELRNLAGISTPESRNLASFKANLERLRNESLRLNKGVQTEGDAIRAWNEILKNINDPKLVAQRLDEVQKLNERAAELRKMNINVIRSNYGLEPLDVSGRTNVPSAYSGKETTHPKYPGFSIAR